MITDAFKLTVGVNAGYFHANADDGSKVGEVWQRHAATVFAETGVYVGATVTTGKTVYNTAWGCPVGGENTAVISGLRNPEFNAESDAWKIACQKLSVLVGKELCQTTAYLEFSQVEFLYLKPS